MPTPFVDNGNFFLNAQSFESSVWYFYCLIFIYLFVGLMRRRYTLNLATISSVLFLLGFISLSAVVDTNDGTAVRHRAVLLIGILVMLATYRRREPNQPQDLSSNFS